MRAIREANSARAERGLMTLEWLLIVAAIAGLAAASVLAIQRVIDDSTDLPPRPDVRVVDAEIEAAQVAHEATEAEKANPGVNVPDQNCRDVADKYSDVVKFDSWTRPDSSTTPPTVAKCVLTRL